MRMLPLACRSTGLAASVIACLAWLACTSETPRFYALQPLVDPTPVGAYSDLGVAIGPVNLPRYLDEPQIATRKSGSRVQYRDLDRWAGGSLESEVLRILGENIALLLGSDRVVVYPLTGPFPIRYRVRVDIEHFDGRRGDSVDLRAKWVLVVPGQGDALAVEVVRLQEPLPSKKTRMLVAAHGKLLGDLSRQIAIRIVEFEAAPQ